MYSINVSIFLKLHMHTTDAHGSLKISHMAAIMVLFLQCQTMSVKRNVWAFIEVIFYYLCIEVQVHVA